MKTLFGLIIILASLGSSKAQNFAAVQVDGIGCQFCAYGIEKQFGEIKGVKGLEIALETGLVTFKGVEDAGLNPTSIAETVRKAGYTPRSLGLGKTKKEAIHNMTKIDGPIEAKAGSDTFTIGVSGNCGMCKTRIENAAMAVDGVIDAQWSEEEKELSLVIDSQKTNQELVEKAVAASGHDTQNEEAHDWIYKTLPACCKYR